MEKKTLNGEKIFYFRDTPRLSTLVNVQSWQEYALREFKRNQITDYASLYHRIFRKTRAERWKFVRVHLTTWQSSVGNSILDMNSLEHISEQGRETFPVSSPKTLFLKLSSLQNTVTMPGNFIWGQILIIIYWQISSCWCFHLQLVERHCVLLFSSISTNMSLNVPLPAK